MIEDWPYIRDVQNVRCSSFPGLAYALSEWCSKPYSYPISETRMLTEAYVFQAFACDQTLLLLLLAQLMPACCSSCNSKGWLARGIKDTNKNTSIQRIWQQRCHRIAYDTSRNTTACIRQILHLKAPVFSK